ncbi:addiction module antitoxin [Campylobacter concisus]|uniref:addiction module antitoxin n=1 Tax=Campylobacter concisus TaxID=199 RepID=UPI000CD84810|nr:addiction module antitoxin [Campylobacter concisus]MBE9817958.1 addiction module antitoxin [Campylobacter concisus]
MSEFLSEVFTLSLLFIIIGFYAIYRAKKAQSEHEKNVASYDKNLLNFAKILGVQNHIDLVKFDEILAQALKEKLIFKFNKTTSQEKFISFIKDENFKIKPQISQNSIDEAFLNLCASSLIEPLNLAILKNEDQIYGFLFEKEQLFALVDSAALLGENIIICE